MAFQKIGSLGGVDAFRNHLHDVVGDVPVDDTPLAGTDSPLAATAEIDCGSRVLRVGNRWVVHPMEGWDGTAEGNPGEHTLRRWRNFGLSGAKLIWGGEAVAVRHDGRANPNQLVSHDSTAAGLERLRTTLVAAHQERWGDDRDLVVGLQLTHSGRFARPHRKDRAEPRIAFRHPILDRRVGADDSTLITDAAVADIIEGFVAAAVRAQESGYDFVDIKHCHGYLLHEFLGAHTRPGSYGGSFENRTRILREIITGIRTDAPDLAIGVRVSIFDVVPFRPDPQQQTGATRRPGTGIPEDFGDALPYRWGFGVHRDDPTRFDLTEGVQFLELLRSLGIRLVNISGGSPYYNPHIQRPALYPPSDGYRPPEDPLVGVFRQLRVVHELKRRFPDLFLVGSAFSYLQDYLPHVAQGVVRDGWMDFVGLGRMILSYWDLPGDCLEGRLLQKNRFCRTFSDCTTAPRNGLVSGCYPLDRHYAKLPESATLKEIKSRRKTT